MNHDRHIRKAKVSLLLRCCRQGFRKGRVPREADRLLWILREHLALPPRVSAATIDAARRASIRDHRQGKSPLDREWISRQARREVERYGLQGSAFEADLEFLRADLASPHLAEGGVRDGMDQLLSQPGAKSQVLPAVTSRSRLEGPRWRPGRALRALALGLVVALGMTSLGLAWGTRPVRTEVSADVSGHQRTLRDLLGREAAAGEDHEAEILATYQALFSATPEGAERRQVREEWAGYLRLRSL